MREHGCRLVTRYHREERIGQACATRFFQPALRAGILATSAALAASVERPSGMQRRQGRNPAALASSMLSWKQTFFGLAVQTGRTGRTGGRRSRSLPPNTRIGHPRSSRGPAPSASADPAPRRIAAPPSVPAARSSSAPRFLMLGRNWRRSLSAALRFLRLNRAGRRTRAGDPTLCRWRRTDPFSPAGRSTGSTRRAYRGFGGGARTTACLLMTRAKPWPALHPRRRPRNEVR